jgi:hypothetical protein
MRTFALLLTLALTAGAADFRSAWGNVPDRPWIGPEYWSNPLQDWRVQSGRVECFVAGGDRNIFLLTREAGPQKGTLEMTVRLGRLDSNDQPLNDGFAGFRFGIRGTFKDYRDSAVRGDGSNAGITSTGRVFIGLVPADGAVLPEAVSGATLRLTAIPQTDGTYTVRLRATAANGKWIESVREKMPADQIGGGLALVCHSGEIPPTPQPPEVLEGFGERRHTARGGTLRYWFSDWHVSGTKVVAHDEHAWGPVLFTMHTLSKRVLKLAAQFAPISPAEPQQAELQISKGGKWIEAARAIIDPMARTATFRVAEWDDSRDTPYRVVYGTQSYGGTIRKDPVSKPKITVAAFTGNNDLGFPHADVVRNVRSFAPDLLFYSGDNIYERVGEYGIQRSPVETATLDYLRKWFLFGWEYGELLKDIPSVAIPDDHDVYHGNLWGAGGRRTEGEGYIGPDKGGYVMPAEWVNMVQRTQTSNLPDPPDPTPVDQGIGVYYSQLVVGGVSFAVLEDRKWKSAPRPAIPWADIVNGWAQNPKYDAAKHGDAPGAELLGPRQEKFLEDWAKDWSGGVWMKTVLSQTIFSNVATLPKGTTLDTVTPKLRVEEVGGYAENEAPVQDHDSNGWPQTPRSRAIAIMRKAFAFHIAGDQHLGSTIQYGLDEWNDAGWALCVPSVANVWPRRWFPSEPGRNPKPDMVRNSGEFVDGFGNKITVHAVSNPFKVPYEPKALMHRAPGYGIVTFHRATRDITIANWPRWVDATRPGAQPYPGWPITINQLDNGFPKRGTTLAPVRGTKPNPVIQVVNKKTGEIEYTYRAKEPGFSPRVRKPGEYEIRILE